MFMFGSSGNSLQNQRPESVDCRASIEATGANVDRESFVPTVFSSSRNVKRDRDQIVVHSLKGRENPYITVFERKVDSVV